MRSHFSRYPYDQVYLGCELRALDLNPCSLARRIAVPVTLPPPVLPADRLSPYHHSRNPSPPRPIRTR